MTFVNVLPALNLAPKSLNLRQNLSKRYLEWLQGQILGRENIDKGHFRLVAMFAFNTAKSSINFLFLKKEEGDNMV